MRDGVLAEVVFVPRYRSNRYQDADCLAKQGEVGISGIVWAELWFGVAHSQKKKQNEAALKDFLGYATLLNWPCEASPFYGKIRSGLQKQGKPIGAMELLIATHALYS